MCLPALPPVPAGTPGEPVVGEGRVMVMGGEGNGRGGEGDGYGYGRGG